MLYYTLGQNIEKKTHWPPIAAVTVDGPAVLLADSLRRDGRFPGLGKLSRVPAVPAWRDR